MFITAYNTDEKISCVDIDKYKEADVELSLLAFTWGGVCMTTPLIVKRLFT
jgi:hypothetical protein